MTGAPKPTANIDRLLAYCGAAVSVALFLVPRTPVTVSIFLVVIFFLLLHPAMALGRFARLGSFRLRGWVAVAVLLAFVSVLAVYSWPPPHAKGLSAPDIADEVLRRLPTPVPAFKVPPAPAVPTPMPTVGLDRPRIQVEAGVGKWTHQPVLPADKYLGAPTGITVTITNVGVLPALDVHVSGCQEVAATPPKRFSCVPGVASAVIIRGEEQGRLFLSLETSRQETTPDLEEALSSGKRVIFAWVTATYSDGIHRWKQDRRFVVELNSDRSEWTVVERPRRAEMFLLNR